MATYHGEDMMGVGRRKRFIASMKKAITTHLALNGIKRSRVFLVGTGCSGVALASVLSYSLGVRWGFVRKEEDTKNHSWGSLETRQHMSGDYVIAVDDFVSVGDTARSLYNSIKYNALAVGHCGTCDAPEKTHKQVGIRSITIITPPEGEG